MILQDLDVVDGWLKAQLGPITNIAPLAGDASPRRYWRVISPTNTFILMHAPHPSQRTPEFILIAKYLAKLGLSAPQIIAVEPTGWVLLSDLGPLPYQEVLSPATVDVLYTKAMEALIVMQRAPCDQLNLPRFDKSMMDTELMLFEHWFVEVFLEASWASEDKAAYYEFKDALLERIEVQPYTFVHRDYHSRNLMVQPPLTPGILDFQDAVVGPVTYDLISLIEDAYVAWSPEQVNQWVQQYLSMMTDARIVPHPPSLMDFKGWCVDMALQRQLKVIGIFSRLFCRDDKPRYLEDMPRVANYICSNLRAAAPYVPIQFMSFWFTKMIPALQNRLLRHKEEIRGTV